MKKNTSKKTIIKGMAVVPGKIIGKVKVVKSKNDIEKVKKGDIIITPTADTVGAAVVKKVCAVIFDRAGRTSHVVIACREYKIPCVINTKNACQTICTGDLVDIDAKRGVVKIVKKRK